MKADITKCIEVNPTAQTIKFGGVSINLTKLCETTGVKYSYLSLILNGRRVPKVQIAKQIAEGLGIGLETFLDIQESQKPRAKRRHKVAA